MKNYRLLLIAALCAVSPLNAAAGASPAKKPARPGISNLSGSFTRTYSTQSQKDSVSGAFCFFDMKKTYLDIRYPLHQIMFIENNVLLIYYPESRKAFRLESASPVALPLIPGLLSAIRPDYGLSLIGFKVVDQKMRGDTLVTYWSNPAAADKLGRFELSQCGNRLLSSTYFSSDSKTCTRTLFGAYVAPRGGYSFPASIRTIVRTGETVSTENVYLRDLVINGAIPRDALEFKIPDDVKVIRKKW